MRLAICPIETCPKCGTPMSMANVRFGVTDWADKDGDYIEGPHYLAWECIRCHFGHKTDTLDANDPYFGAPGIEERP